MSLRHSAFLFDYHAFQATAVPLMAALDVGDFGPLQEHVTRICQKVGPYENWILDDRGTFLESFDSDLASLRRSDVLGHYFLIVLSAHLRPCTSLGYDWRKLSHTLDYLGWNDEDKQRLFAGLPIVQLLKPEVQYQPGLVIQLSHPYWYWIGPAHSIYNGWLPVEEVVRLQRRLQADQHLLDEDIRTRISLPPNVSAENAHISKELDPDYWYARIPIVYHQAIEMMGQALEAGEGLFMVVEE